MRSTNLRLEGAPLSPSFRGTPAEFYAELVRLLRIVSPDGHYGIVVSDVEPESNQGLWLKDGTKLYVWSDDEARYVPADITDGIATQLTQLADLVSKANAGRIIFSVLQPGENERLKVLWAQIGESNAVLAMKVWDPAAQGWRLLPGTTQFAVSTTGLEDNQYRITLDSPVSVSQLIGVPVVVKWHRTSTGPVTIAVTGLPDSKTLVNSLTGAQVGENGIREGQLSQLIYDGTEWHTMTPVRVPEWVGDSLYASAQNSGQPPGPLEVSVTRPAGAEWVDFDVWASINARTDNALKLKCDLLFGSGTLDGLLVNTKPGCGNVGQYWEGTVDNDSSHSTWRFTGPIPSEWAALDTITFASAIVVENGGFDGDSFQVLCAKVGIRKPVDP